jgi:putative transposase
VTNPNVCQLSQPGTFADPLTEVLRNGARALLAQAVGAEVAVFLSCHADKLTDDGRQRLVRHGYLPEREIMTGIGPVAVRCPRMRDRVGMIALLGKDAGGLSASTIARLKDAWSEEHSRWSRSSVCCGA